MIKKVFSVICFVISVLCLLAVGYLTVSLIDYYNHVNSLPSASGIDYLGFLFYPVFYCFAAVPGIAASAISMRLAAKKSLRIISLVLLIGFAAVLFVFGMTWLSRL